MIYSIPVYPHHITQIIKKMRFQEKFEYSLLNDDPADAIRKTVYKSAVAWSAFKGDEIVCMWGIVEESVAGGAHIWLVTTDLIEKYKKSFLVESKKKVLECLKTFPYMYGFVDVNYEKSRRWMEWIGFKPGSTVKMKNISLIRYELRAP